MVVECQCGQINYIPDEAKADSRYRCGNRNCRKELYVIRATPDSKDKEPAKSRAGLNRRHKFVLFLTLVSTGGSLVCGLGIREALGIALLGFALAWVVGSKSVYVGMIAIKARVPRILDAVLKVAGLPLCAILLIGGVAGVPAVFDVAEQDRNKLDYLYLLLPAFALVTAFIVYRKSQSGSRSKQK
jgi:hypothetical protein